MPVDEIIKNIGELAGIAAVILGAFGLFIANLSQSIKARSEAQKTNAEAQEIRKHQKEVLDQFKTNGGSTMKDATDRIETDLKEFSKRMDSQLKNIRGEMSFQRREILRLAEVDDNDREATNELNKELKRGMSSIERNLQNHIDDVPNVITKVKTQVLETLNDEKRGQHAIRQ